MGPALGGILSGISFTFPFFLRPGWPWLTFLLFLFCLKESLTREKRIQQLEEVTDDSGISIFLSELRTPLVQFFIMLFLASVAHSMNEATYALFMQNKIGMGAKEAGWAFYGCRYCDGYSARPACGQDDQPFRGKENHSHRVVRHGYRSGALAAFL